jgi:hypothetical protein
VMLDVFDSSSAQFEQGRNVGRDDVTDQFKTGQ